MADLAKWMQWSCQSCYNNLLGGAYTWDFIPRNANPLITCVCGPVSVRVCTVNLWGLRTMLCRSFTISARMIDSEKRVKASPAASRVGLIAVEARRGMACSEHAKAVSETCLNMSLFCAVRHACALMPHAAEACVQHLGLHTPTNDTRLDLAFRHRSSCLALDSRHFSWARQKLSATTARFELYKSVSWLRLLV